MTLPFMNDDAALRRQAEEVLAQRKRHGLENAVGGLEAVVIMTEPENQRAAVDELLRYTGLYWKEGFEDQDVTACVLGVEGSADFLVCSRKGGDNPFAAHNANPKSVHLPNTRLETFVYACPDLERYAAIQKARGLKFLTEAPVDMGSCLFLQSPPSAYTGNSIGLIQWKDGRRRYATRGSRPLGWAGVKPENGYNQNIFELDHTAARVRAEHRDPAILEFMEYTNYGFDFAVYVEALNSITNVARLPGATYAQVFTSGISPFVDLAESGPTEKYIYNYGTRVHHMAFRTEDIEATYQALAADGMGFLVELVGSREEGLKQTFTRSSPNTLLVNEYIKRFDGFTGFFTKSNVTMLTAATENQ